MIMLFRKTSLWAALAGVAAVILMVSRTTAVEPIPPLAAPPAPKPSARGIAAAGMVEALHENTNIGIPLDALVQRVHVRVWEQVEQGAPLLQLDDRELRAQLETQLAEQRVCEAEVLKIRRQHERAETLRARQAVSQEEADSRLDEFSVARARLDVAKATVAQTQALIERLTVRAPIRGTILQVNTRAGEYATTSSDVPPLVLGCIEEVQVRADVDEQVAPRVVPGSRAIGYQKGDTQTPIEMEFVRIEPFVTPKRNLTGFSSERVDTRVLQVIYKIPQQPSRHLYVGQQMDLFIEEE
jgi:HlyD family secretion protein